jgi:hypothetical protein
MLRGDRPIYREPVHDEIPVELSRHLLPIEAARTGERGGRVMVLTERQDEIIQQIARLGRQLDDEDFFDQLATWKEIEKLVYELQDTVRVRSRPLD